MAEAKSGSAAIDLRSFAAKDASNRLMQSWEIEVAAEVTDATKYEAGNVLDLANYNSGSEQFDNPTSDVEILIDDAREQVRTQTGVYPKSSWGIKIR